MTATKQKVSRYDRVFKTMKSRRWIKGSDITQPEVGGSEGLRRVREMRSRGAEIAMRRIPGSMQFEYRMVKPPTK